MSNPFMNQRLSQEKAVQRYLTALENGDLSAIDSVWQEAAENPALEQLLFNLHKTFSNGQELLASPQVENTLSHKENTMPKNEKIQIKETGSINSSPFSNQPAVRSRHVPARAPALVAVLIIVFIVGGFLALHSWNISLLATPRPTSTPAPLGTPKQTQQPLTKLSPLCKAALPTLYQTEHTSLNDILALSNSNIWMVGYSQGQPLSLHWNGTKWNSFPVPAPVGSTLKSLAALSPNDIWAIGETDYGTGGMGTQPSHTLIEHWNGTLWTRVASPDLLPSTANRLQSVAAIAPNDVWAVGVVGGYSGKGGLPPSSALLEHWDGTHWRIFPLQAMKGASLYSIVALNANDIWAAGDSSVNDGNNKSPLLVHWNGQSWGQIAPQAIDNDSSGQLLKITVDASHNLWALGLDPNGNTLLLSLNKGIWTSFPVPNLFTASNTATIYNQYQDLSITNSQDIWLAGEKVRTSNPSGDTTYTPLVEHWDGHHWQAVSEHYHDSASLLAISVSSGIVWSIGFTYYPGQPFQPFVATTCK